MAQYCNQFEFDESSDEFIMGAEPPEAFSMYPSSNPGPPGPPGPGVPAGGTAGQLLAKASGADYDTEWSDPPELDAEHVTYDDTETYSDGTVGKKLSDLNSAINTIQINKADVIVSSASGAIASFSDGMNAPIVSLIADIEPVQDLHGYDAPWPAGGGKNLLPMTLANMKTINTAGTWNGNAYTLYGVTYTVNVDDGGNVVSISATGTATQYGLFRLVNEWTNASATTISGTASGSSGSGYRLQVERNGTVITQDTGTQGLIPANTSVTRVIIVVPNGVNPSGAVFKPMIRLATDPDTTFAPYANLCPISGHTGVTVYRTGVNQWDEEWENGYYDASGNFVASASYVCPKNLIRVLPQNTYYLASPVALTIKLFDQNKEFIGNAPGTWRNETFKPSNYNADTAYIVFFNASAGAITTYNHDISINYPSTDHDYHAYTGTTDPITFPDAAGTVYKGTLKRNEDGSGVLTVTEKYKRYSGAASEEWKASSWSGTNTFVAYADVAIADAGTDSNTKPGSFIHYCNMLKRVTYEQLRTEDSPGITITEYNRTSIRVMRKDVTNVATLMTYLANNPLDIVYELATPLVYTLTAEQVGAIITTLYGDNNVWASTGDVRVDYRADTRLFIEKLIASLS